MFVIDIIISDIIRIERDVKMIIKWFKNLKGWQKGGLIGLVIGIVFAVLLILNQNHSSGRSPIVLVYYLHFIPFVISDTILTNIDQIKDTRLYITYIVNPTAAFLCIGLGITVIGYTVFGAVVGRVQQVANNRKRWLITSFLALLLFALYLLNFLVTMWFAGL